MPGTLRDKYSISDIIQGQEIASTVIYGFLGNAVPDQEKDRIFKNISLINVAFNGNSTVDQVKAEYGEELGDEVHDFRIYAESTAQSQVPKIDLTPEMAYVHYTHEGVEVTLERYRQSMQELSNLLRENEHRIQFASDLERDYYNLLRQQVDILAGGNSLYEKCMDDASFAFSRNFAAKMGLICATYDTDPEDHRIKKSVVEPPVDTHTFFNRVKDTGLVQAVVGATTLSSKFDKYVKDGSVGRGELVEETRLQVERMKKLMSMDEATHKPLYDERILQGSLQEFTSGERGTSQPLWDAEAKLELLTSGWPAEDIPALSKLYRAARSSWKSYEEADNEYENYVLIHQNPNEDEQAEINRLKTKRDKYEDAFNKLKGCWDDVKSGYNISVDDRRRMLGDILTKVSGIEEQYRPSMLNNCEYNVRKCLERPLKNAEKILMADSVREIYDTIDDDDPALMRSSSEFRAMKKSLKTLADMENNRGDDFDKYEVQWQDTVDLMEKYLSYKHMQLNDPTKNHDRSEREIKRIRDVEAAVYRLKAQTPKPKEAAKQVDIYANPEKRLMESPKASAFDKFIKQHTGYHQIHGPVEDLPDHVAMVMAVTYYKQQANHAPVALADIELQAKKFKKEYMLDYARPESLAEILANPKDILNFKEKNLENLYGMKGLTDNDELYKGFIKDIRVVYKNIPDPEGMPAEYQRVFNAVHELAMMPIKLDGMDVDKINKSLQKNSKIIMENTDKYLLENPGKSSAASGMLDAMSCLNVHNRECGNNELTRYVGNIIDRTNKKRGAAHNLDNNNHIDLEDDYGPRAIRQMRVHADDNLRDMDEDGRQERRTYYEKKEKLIDDFEDEKEVNKSIISFNDNDDEIIPTNFKSMVDKQKNKDKKSDARNPLKDKIKEGAKKRKESIIDTSSKSNQKENDSFLLEIK